MPPYMWKPPNLPSIVLLCFCSPTTERELARRTFLWKSSWFIAKRSGFLPASCYLWATSRGEDTLISLHFLCRLVGFSSRESGISALNLFLRETCKVSKEHRELLELHALKGVETVLPSPEQEEELQSLKVSSLPEVEFRCLRVTPSLMVAAFGPMQP